MDFPVELVEAVFDNVQERTDLQACAAVCRDWSALGQARLFKSITLHKPAKFQPLLEIVRGSSHIASAIKRVEVDVVDPAKWCNDDTTGAECIVGANVTGANTVAGTVAGILHALPNVRSLCLKGLYYEDRIRWESLPYVLQEAVISLVQDGQLEELELDGWVFDFPIHTYFQTFLSSPSLRRVRLKRVFSGLYSTLNSAVTEQGEEGELEWEPVRLNLHELEIHVDDHLDAEPRLKEEDWSRLLDLNNASTKLTLRVWLNTAFWSFGKTMDFFSGPAASVVETLDLTIGLRNNYLWDFTNYSQLRDLTINGVNSPAAIAFTKQTLNTMNPQNGLRKLTLKFCFYSLPRKQWADLVEFFATGPFPSLQSIHFEVTTNQLTDAITNYAIEPIHNIHVDAIAASNRVQAAMQYSQQAHGSSGIENTRQATEVKPASPLASKSTWGERVRGTKLSNGQTTLADLYSVARNPASSSHSLGSQLPPLPQRVKGYPTPCLTQHEVESLLSPLCSRSGWKVAFRLPSDSEPERAALSDCGCAPQDISPQEELPFLINTYHFSSIQNADGFLADAKLLSDVGEFHHYDSYSLTPTSADGSFQLEAPASLTLFVQTHSAISASSVKAPGLTIRDVRYATMLDHLYYSLYASGGGPAEVGTALDDNIKRRLIQ